MANILWLKPGSVVVEILPKEFDCRDWYSKSAIAAGVNYFPYYADSVNESVDGNVEEAAKCMSNRKKCLSKKCIDVLRDRNVNLDIDRFQNELKKYLNSINLFHSF